MQINQDNYLALANYLPDDIKQVFSNYQEIIEMSVLTSADNEAKRQQEINSFFELLQECIESGIIILPTDLHYLFEHSFEQDICTPLSQPNDTVHSQKVNSIKDINPMLQNERKLNINKFKTPENKENNTFKVPVNLQNKTAEKLAASRSTYEYSDFDNKIIKDLDLPEKKQYIYQEIRRKFGNPVDEKILEKYGINHFARKLEKSFPSAYKITEIKTVITRILDYDKYAKACGQ